MRIESLNRYYYDSRSLTMSAASVMDILRLDITR